MNVMKPLFGNRWMPLVGGMMLTGLASGQGAGVVPFDGGKFPGYVVDEVVVPVPSEIFSVLDKLGEPNWKEELRKIKGSDSSDRTLLALVFGTVVAEGFVAVQAQDKQVVEDIGREVIALSKSLGISNAVIPHANSILGASKKNDWKAIRKELDQTQSTVRATMERMRDEDLAQCVSLAGWLRGTAAVTSVVNKAYTEDRAELLNQPMLVDHFTKALASMSKEAASKPTISAISNGLVKIRLRMESANGDISRESISAIKDICDELLLLISKDGKVKGK
jgi:hypothetical protein